MKLSTSLFLASLSASLVASAQIRGASSATRRRINERLPNGRDLGIGTRVGGVKNLDVQSRQNFDTDTSEPNGEKDPKADEPEDAGLTTETSFPKGGDFSDGESYEKDDIEEADKGEKEPEEGEKDDKEPEDKADDADKVDDSDSEDEAPAVSPSKVVKSDYHPTAK
ncbi:MAG: hypothetical protein SGILL_009768, partial [Bacillariaceae sp.]